MGKRLQVVLDDEELTQIRRIALKHHMAMAEWIRQALRKAIRVEPRGDANKKLAAVCAAVDHCFPVAGIDKMLLEIERGYLDDGAT